MKRITFMLLVLVGIIAAGLVFLTATRPGLQWIVQLGSGYLPGEVTFEKIEGRLLGPVRLQGVTFRDPGGTVIAVESAQFDWRPTELLTGVVHVTSLITTAVRIQPGKNPAAPAGPPDLPDVFVPLVLQLDDLRIDSIDVAGTVVREIRAAASLTGDQLRVRQLEAHAGKHALKAQARLQLRGHYPAQIDLTFDTVLPEGRRVSASAELKGDIRHVDITAAVGDTLELRGALDDLFTEPNWRAEIRARQWRVSDWFSAAQLGEVSGRIDGEGDLQTAAARGAMELVATRIGDIKTTLDVRWADRVLTIDKLEAAAAGGPERIIATGSVNFPDQGPPAYDLDAQWQGLRGAGWSAPQGRLTATGTTSVAKASLNARVGDGSVDEKLSPLTAHVELRGIDSAKPWFRVDADAPSLHYQQLLLEDLSVHAVIDMAGTQESQVTVRAGSLAAGEHALQDLLLTGSGTPQSHRVIVQARHPAAQFEASLSGAYRKPRWDGTLETLTFGTTDVGEWRLAGTVPLAAGPDQARLEQLCLAPVTGDGRACANARWARDAGWASELDIRDLALSPWLKLWRPEVAWNGDLDLKAKFSGDTQLRSGRLTAGSACCTVSVTDAGETYTTQYRDLKIDLDLQAEGATGKTSVVLPDYGSVDGNARITGAPEQDWSKRAIDATVKMQLSSLTALQPLVPWVRLEQGSANADLKIKGRVDDPQMTGTVKVEDGAIQVPQAGVKLEQLEVLVRAEGTQRAQLTSSARAGDGTLRATGTMQWSQGNIWQAVFQVDGDRITAIQLPEASVVASPQLRIGMAPGTTTVQGKVAVDEARITPQLSRGGNIVLSPDVVVVSGEEAEPVPAMRVSANISTELGRETVFDGYGLNGHLRGAIDVMYETGKATRATGEIHVADGSYKIYGQTLVIETGRLIFTGGSIDDPGLDVRATRKVNEVTAGVLVRGTVTDPTFKLFSEPAMPDSELLSYLILGRPPASRGSGSDAALLAAAAQSLLTKDGGVTSRLKSTLGLEELSLQSSGDTNGRALVLGKYLSPKLYVSYAAGLAEAINVFRVRYQLARNWLVQTESSTRESGGEIIFSIER